MKHFNIKIYGLVHGVFFRTSAKEKADELDILGSAKNMPDGSVYIEAEGESDKLKKFLSWCHKGPSAAKVEKVSVQEEKIKNFSEFTTN